jgi:hypothetical protein
MAGAGVFPKVLGDTIYAQDFNTVKDVVQSVYTTAYGQTSTVPTVSNNAGIFAAPWDLLRAELDLCYTHITGSIAGVANVAPGDAITSTDVNLYKTRADYCFTNRLTVYAATQLALAAASSSNRAGTAWNTSISHQVRITFATTADAQYFFACGGYFTSVPSASGGSGGTKNTNWATAINGVGSSWTYAIADYNAGNKSTNYAVSSYSPSVLTISCVKESGSSLLFTALFNDSSVGIPDENIDLNITSNFSYYKSVSAVVSAIPSAVTVISTL